MQKIATCVMLKISRLKVSLIGYEHMALSLGFVLQFFDRMDVSLFFKYNTKMLMQVPNQSPLCNHVAIWTIVFIQLSSHQLSDALGWGDECSRLCTFCPKHWECKYFNLIRCFAYDHVFTYTFDTCLTKLNHCVNFSDSHSVYTQSWHSL